MNYGNSYRKHRDLPHRSLDPDQQEDGFQEDIWIDGLVTPIVPVGHFPKLIHLTASFE